MSSRPNPRVRPRPVLSRGRYVGTEGLSAICHCRRALGVLALLPSLLGAQAPAPALSRIAFVGVSVVNVETGAIEPNRTVLVAQGKIVRIEQADHVLPRDFTRIPARGQYLIPGLWDMHVHLAVAELAHSTAPQPDFSLNADWQFPLLLAAGVTGVRDMSGAFGQLRAWRNEIAAGQRAGPRIVHTGWKLRPDGPVLPGGPSPVRTVADVERAVEMLAKADAPFVKVDGMSAEHLLAAISAANRHRMAVVGHVAPWMSARESSELGISSIDHLTQVVVGGSTEETELLAEARREFSWWGKALVGLGWWDPAARRESRMERSVATWDSVKAMELFTVFARNTTWQTPTLTGLRDVRRIQSEIPGPRRRWLPPSMLRRDSAGLVAPVNRALRARQFQLERRIIPMLARAGVPLLAGTDAPGTRRVPGQSLIEELEMLVDAGLTPLEALRSATLNPARFLGLTDSLGSVTAGKVADLVLLEANPLTDITALRRVRGVVAGGRYYSHPDLERRLDLVQALLQKLGSGDPPVAITGTPASPGDR